MNNKFYILENETSIYVPMTKEDVVELMEYIVSNHPTVEELTYKMVEENHMSSIQAYYMTKFYKGRHVNWINLAKLGKKEDNYFVEVYEMTFLME